MPSYVIVGASRGLGYAWLQHLSRDPTNTVIGLARTPGPVQDQLIADSITNVPILPADLSSYPSLSTSVTLCTPLLPSGLDVLIINGVYHNPATIFPVPTDFSSPSQAALLHDDMHASLDVNVLGVINAINLFLPLVEKSEVKKIVVISTGAADLEEVLPEDGRFGIPVLLPYAAMKAALNLVVGKFAADVAERGVLMLSLSPGIVDTVPGGIENMPEEIAVKFGEMAEMFKRKAPGWEGPLQPLDSVGYMEKVIDGLTMKDSGKFLSHWGNKTWL